MGDLGPDGKLPPVKRKMYTLRDLDKLKHNDLYSAFGSMSLSTKSTGPSAPIGKGTRAGREKMFQSKQEMNAHKGKG